MAGEDTARPPAGLPGSARAQRHARGAGSLPRAELLCESPPRPSAASAPRGTPPPAALRRWSTHPAMLSWDRQIDAVVEDTPLITLRTGHTRDREHTRALLVLYAALFVLALAVSLDSMSFYLYLNYACSEFHALSSVGTIIIVQQLVRAVSKPPFAQLSDLFGRIPTLVAVVVLYASGHAVLASATTFAALLLGTIVQALGATGIGVLQSVIIADTTSVQWRGLLIGLVNLPYVINFAFAGPLVGTAMRLGGWRLGFAIWVVVLPVAAAPLLTTLAVGCRRARRQKGPAHAAPSSSAHTALCEMDLLGMGLFSAALTLMLLPVSLHGFSSLVHSCERAELLVGLALLVAFAAWETYTPHPFLPYRAVRNFTVVAVCAIAAIDFAGFYLSWAYLSPFIQVLKGWDQVRTAYFVSTQNVTSTIMGVVVGSCMALTRQLKRYMVAGYVVRILGLFLMVHFRSLGHSTLSLVLCQVLQGVGGGALALTTQVAAQVAVPHAQVAVVTAFQMLTTEVGAALGSALASALVTSLLPRELRLHLPMLSPPELDRIEGSLDAVLEYPLGSPERLGITEAWVGIMRMLCLVSVAIQLPALALSLAVPNVGLHETRANMPRTRSLRRVASARSQLESRIASPPWRARAAGSPLSTAAMALGPPLAASASAPADQPCATAHDLRPAPS